MENCGHFTRLPSEEVLQLCINTQAWCKRYKEQQYREGAAALMKVYNESIKRSNKWRRLLHRELLPLMTEDESLERLKSADPVPGYDPWSDRNWSIQFNGSRWWRRVESLRISCGLKSEQFVDGELLQFMLERSYVPNSEEPNL